ncbi:hypothetical protein I302_103794 [Kwoniella bestiolae CBS 10118]|uniref:Uncharacterized protein n=1 Tax=Kwoniella bestiolae CBS 10118 TaxID=1296100 RepID=A0A1B9G9G7_9TREE|nr:hypothetical protein I302_02497 [Kwoniella bestiolae CBS 10118]OCF27653.1 hypothetical protein I302_02497 [Kwoniella bestiolae CBS 10118]
MTPLIHLLALFLPLSTLALPALSTATPSYRTILKREDDKVTTTMTTTITTDNPPSTTSLDKSTAKAEDNLFGKVASLAAERASSSANGANGDGTKLSTAQYSAETPTSKENKDVRSTLTVQIDPYTCASDGDEAYCNEASPEKRLPIHTVYSDNATTTSSWVFSAYEKGDANTGYWKDSDPVKVVNCEIQIIPGGESDGGTVQVHTQKPFVKEVDPKNLLRLKCDGEEGDVEKDEGEKERKMMAKRRKRMMIDRIGQ